MNNKVAIVRCADYTVDKVYRALKLAVESAGGLDAAGKTVLLKPNILFDAAPEKAICTHPGFLEAAIQLLNEMGAKRIIVGDSPGLQPPGFSAKTSGIGAVVKKTGSEWRDFTKGKIELSGQDGRVMKVFTVTDALKEADFVISLPKLKTHQLMYFTGAMKNLFGLIPTLTKSTFHVRFPSQESFAAMITDLNLAVKPAYAFMDAIIAMEGPGPSAGKPRKLGLVLASSNLLALDAAACGIIGYPPDKIPINREALSRNYWLKGFDEIEYPCLTVEEVKVTDFVKVHLKKSLGPRVRGLRAPSQLLDFLLPKPIRCLRDALSSRPGIDRSLCIRCGDCTRICGSRAMELKGEGKEKYVHIDYRRCIRCYCCHEICPVHAIEVKKAGLGR
ncbi:MAG: DUF362 domain-containing protein [Treponema sp.]|jgi:uncharacterized protein (DUF362 family)/Pyruvate/2-oxoacid:ferredoxin oxidoreductase delta subunit|nr:DUF362 domain-containing protein [Treponema sp.]